MKRNFQLPLSNLMTFPYLFLVDQIFYLNSRGLSKLRAEKILLQGIINEYIPENSPLINFLPENYK